MAKRTFLTAILLLALLVGGCRPPQPTLALSETEQSELTMLTGQLSDPERSAKTRVEAAALLLNRANPQATEALVAFLSDSSNPPAQIAVAQAVAQQHGGHEMFVEPLLTMLTGPDPQARAAGGSALATYEGDEVIDRVIAIASDARRPQEIRLAAIASLSGMLDKRAVAAMIRLLGDPQETLHDAAASALVRLTNIRAFGGDSGEWKRWWQRNKDREQSQWLADMAQSLSESKTALEAENARMRDRLTKAMTELYVATPAAQRDAMLLGLLKDTLGEVRLAGTTLAYRRLAANEPVTDEIRQQVRSMLADSDGRVRRSSAMLLAGLGDTESLRPLLDRLRHEREPAVREGLLVAAGQLRDPQALPAVLAEVPAHDEAVAAAAADALSRIVEGHPLAAAARGDAGKVLVERYELAAESPTGLPLREALLTAMGVVANPGSLPVMEAAMKDRAATVRMAAVNAMAKLRDARAEGALAALVSDSDRGVRQAAIVALGALGSQTHVTSILSRTDPKLETDAAVRQKAWDVATELLKTADAATLHSVADALSTRADARDQRIGILQILVTASDSGDDLAARAENLRLLGQALLAADRPAEAEPHLAQAVQICQQINHPDRQATWNDWIAALLASDDLSVVAAIDSQADDGQFSWAMQKLDERLVVLKELERHSVVIALGQAVLEQLPHRLTAEQRDFQQQLLDAAMGEQKRQDRRHVSELVAQLRSSDATVSLAAAEQLQEMGEPAVRPLLDELRISITARVPDALAEKAIVGVLAQVAPDLNGYDLDAPLADKTALIARWGGMVTASRKK